MVYSFGRLSQLRPEYNEMPWCYELHVQQRLVRRRNLPDFPRRYYRVIKEFSAVQEGMLTQGL